MYFEYTIPKVYLTQKKFFYAFKKKKSTIEKGHFR